MTPELNVHLAQTPPAASLLGRQIVRIDDSGVVHLTFLARPEFANRHGAVQGGLVSAMLDSATSAALLAQLPPELTSLTAELTTAFVRPTPLGPLKARAWIFTPDERGAETRAELIDPEGQLVAHATAKLRTRRRDG